MINKKIIRSSTLGDGFIIFQTEDGYFLGIHGAQGLIAQQTIDKETYCSLDKREGKR